MSIENATNFLEELKEERDKLNTLIRSIELYLYQNKANVDPLSKGEQKIIT